MSEEKKMSATEIVDHEVSELIKMLPVLGNCNDKAELLMAIELHALNKNMSKLIDAVKGVDMFIR